MLLSFCLLLYLLISTLYNHSPCFSRFLQWYHRQHAIPSLWLFPSTTTHQWSPFTLLGSEVTPDYAFTSLNFNLGASNERKHVFCLSGSGLPDLIWYCPVPSIYLNFHYFLFLYIWIILQSLYVPHFYYSFISWKTCRLFPFPTYCEQRGNKPGWARIWRMLLSHLDICQGMA